MAQTRRLNVVNHTEEPLGLVLEPSSGIYALPPGASRTVLNVGAAPAEAFSVSMEKGYIKVWVDGDGSGTLELGEPEDRRRPLAEAALREAVRVCLEDPLDPPSGESLSTVVGALDRLLYVLWPLDEATVTDGVVETRAERADGRVMLWGVVHMLSAHGHAHAPCRALAAELSAAGESTIRVGAANEEIALRPFPEMKFADPTASNQWEHTFRMGAGQKSY